MTAERPFNITKHPLEHYWSDREQAENAAIDAVAEALDFLDAALDSTHPEGHGCDICQAVDDVARKWHAFITARPAADHPTPEPREYSRGVGIAEHVRPPGAEIGAKPTWEDPS